MHLRTIFRLLATTRNANITTYTLSSVQLLFLVPLLPMPKTLSEPPLPLERRERRSRLNHDTQKLMVSDKENGRWVPKKMLFLPFPPPPPPLWNQSLPSHWATEEAPPPPEEEGGKRGDESPCREFSFSPRLGIKVCSSAFWKCVLSGRRPPGSTRVWPPPPPRSTTTRPCSSSNNNTVTQRI